MDGVLSDVEASRFIETAERLGLEHQGSRGAAHGEVYLAAASLLAYAQADCQGSIAYSSAAVKLAFGHLMQA